MGRRTLFLAVPAGMLAGTRLGSLIPLVMPRKQLLAEVPLGGGRWANPSFAAATELETHLDARSASHTLETLSTALKWVSMFQLSPDSSQRYFRMNIYSPSVPQNNTSDFKHWPEYHLLKHINDNNTYIHSTVLPN